MIRLISLLIISLLVIANASQGDNDISFRMCTRQCSAATCSDTKNSRFGNGFPYWGCDDDCSYDCMQSITEERASQGYGPLKYYGHWPFLRFLGLEEPASVLFSILNGVPYVISLIGILSSNRSKSQAVYMDNWLVLYYIISINTWFASAFFHSRKTELASFYDYSSALLFLGYSLWLAVRRILGGKKDSRVVAILFLFCCCLFSYQVSQMYAGYVSFDDHMRVSVTIAVLNVVTWLIWLIYSSKSSKVEGEKVCGSEGRNGNYRYLCLLCQLWFSVAALLELFDFPAIIGLFDAHSLWHAATIPLGFLWAHFWQLDREMNQAKHKDDL